MESRIEDDVLIIELPLQKPHRSSTGKTLLIASTYGVRRSDARFRGKAVSVVANAFIFPDDFESEKASRASGRRLDERDADEED